MGTPLHRITRPSTASMPFHTVPTACLVAVISWFVIVYGDGVLWQRTFRFAIVADMDQRARVAGGAVSRLRLGSLVQHSLLEAGCSVLAGGSPGRWSVAWTTEVALQ